MHQDHDQELHSMSKNWFQNGKNIKYLEFNQIITKHARIQN